jgi:hypothetical protein
MKISRTTGSNLAADISGAFPGMLSLLPNIHASKYEEDVFLLLNLVPINYFFESMRMRTVIL